MLNANSEFGDLLGRHAMRRAGAAFRESFIASRFAAHRKADAVRLLRPRKQATPDFAIMLNQVEAWYETTEADRPGRKRMDEYASDDQQAGVEHIPDDHWVEPDTYADVINVLTTRKGQKSYDKCDGLIIWSNAFPIAQQDQLNERWWQEAARPAQTAFPEVWCHFQDQFSRIF